ncbi:LysR family glycine cleavage system transcriptional activator [Yoonia maricola]|uniref:LysR family glycine cleavage system transcriptional activator n=1 Tax=Yoonia maricola TaxID=420999 RepID=A0A2M8W5P8_9RHOB|nr:transcriptional regulator GcvA [Yoonia maricola]PJI86261.1 LysR family glycine cleavage system transcriptional activator [Yoonia maricola]
MSDRLPPLTALRAFEAAARHMSFAKAADELNVTPAALSYQIKALEADLGQPVFRRLNRAVELTEAGRCLAPGATDAFTTLSTAWRSTKRLTDSGVLTVTAGPAFTSKWLAPRMYDFAQAHEDIDLRFSATLRIVDFNRDEVDVAIRFGLGGDEGVYSRPIFDEWMTPMMTPQLAKAYDTPDKLVKATFIHDDSINFLKLPTGWDAWLKAMKIKADTSHGPRFSQADHAIDAAIAGAGVVMGRASLVARALEDGQLVAPFDLGLTSEAQYRFICPLGNERRPHIAAFEAWVLEEIQSSKHIAEGRRLINASDLL